MARERGGPKGGQPVATISNYAFIGIEWATPVPMPEESLIPGIGAVKNMPVWEKNTWGRIRGCELTITLDHRVADGAAAGALLKRVIYLLEHPKNSNNLYRLGPAPGKPQNACKLRTKRKLQAVHNPGDERGQRFSGGLFSCWRGLFSWLAWLFSRPFYRRV